MKRLGEKIAKVIGFFLFYTIETYDLLRGIVFTIWRRLKEAKT